MRTILAVLPLLAFTLAAEAQQQTMTPVNVTPPGAPTVSATPPAAADSGQPIKVDFTNLEIQALGRLLDSAVKCQGLSAAQNAVYLAQKLQTALDASNKAAEKPPAK